MPWKQPRITNVWSKTFQDEGGDLFSRVIFESTSLYGYQIKKQDQQIILEGTGVMLNMPEGGIDINDGLVRKMFLEQTGPDTVRALIYLEHPAGYIVEVQDGIPLRIVITLERSFIHQLFNGRKIVIDPGHGGKDPGAKGPVNLLEKNVVVPIAKNLKNLLEQAGARVILTRKGDETLSQASRMKIVRKEKPDLFISLHTHSGENSQVRGASVLYGPVSPESLELANQVRQELLKKLKLDDRGLQEGMSYAALGGIPAIEVEVVTITNWVEEGLLRSPTVHKKAAEGIFNGVKNYFAERQKQVLA